MEPNPIYSFIIPVYNRPEELRDLLNSLCGLKGSIPFEVIVVEDGSVRPAKEVAEAVKNSLRITYLTQSNTGPAGARNNGAKNAQGEMLIFLDSDTVIPHNYLEAVHESLQAEPVELWGGPDKAAKDFSVIQKAINYSMTSFWTTGGIRGGKRKIDKFYPRTFNLGVSRSAFLKVEGFGPLRFGEDLDFSMRVMEQGFRSKLIPEAWVYHKRRVSWKQFFKQVYNSGMARITLTRLHPKTLKLVHLLPSLFVISHITILVVALIGYPHLLLLPVLYSLLIMLDAMTKGCNCTQAFCCVLATYIQLGGYGIGFLHAFGEQIILRKDVRSLFNKSFYE